MQKPKNDERLDSFVSRITPDITRSYAAKLCEDGHILVNGQAKGKSAKLSEVDVVQINLPSIETLDTSPEDIPIDIVFEDEHIIVINKPKGMVVHPAPGNKSGTLVNALLFHCGERLSGIGGVARPGIVHRIDKNTSGLLVCAKTNLAHQSLSEQMKDHNVSRIYDAVVYGKIEDDGTVDAPIGRNQKDRKKMSVVLGGREAVTHYEPVCQLNRFTHICCRLETGRTHQIRVHMAHIGHPVAGDDVYGPKKVIKNLDGQCLNASQLSFTHPKTGKAVTFTVPLPEYFTEFIRKNALNN
jgi:pseudouridine synthase, RluA family